MTNEHAVGLQSLPPVWRMEVHGPACGWPNCTIILAGPKGVDVRFFHAPTDESCEFILELQNALGCHKLGKDSEEQAAVAAATKGNDRSGRSSKQTRQALPAGWRLQAKGPSGEPKVCTITITNPRGTQFAFIRRAEQLACDLTRQLEDEMESD